MPAVNRLRTRARDDSKRVQISFKYYAIITTRHVIFPELGRSRASTEVAIRRQCGFIYRLVKYIVLFYRYYAAFRRSPPSFSALSSRLSRRPSVRTYLLHCRVIVDRRSRTRVWNRAQPVSERRPALSPRNGFRRLKSWKSSRGKTDGNEIPLKLVSEKNRGILNESNTSKIRKFRSYTFGSRIVSIFKMIWIQRFNCCRTMNKLIITNAKASKHKIFFIKIETDFRFFFLHHV